MDPKKTYGLSNQQYRKLFREERIPKNYSAFVHVGFNLSVLLFLVIYNFLQIKFWNWSVTGAIALVAIFGNAVVFVVHKYPLHRRYQLWPFPYQSHTVEHHRYFISNNITFTDSRDYFAIFFPTFVVAGFALFLQPFFFYSTSFFFGKDIGHAFTGATAIYFLVYEFFHWASHVKEDHLLMKCSWIAYMREHHRAHHNPKLMSNYNFCIIYPMMDILMGTKYKGQLSPENKEE